jgi:peroxiredoxin Q/BCP
MLKIGDKAPEIVLPSSLDYIFKLSDLKGKKIILYFYPKDNTSGCTKQACDFRDNYSNLKDKNIFVIGISKDSVDSHNKFIKKFDLPFILLSDPECSVLVEYGVWKEKKMYGKSYMGIERTTFLINENGVIENIYQKVKVLGHIEEIKKFYGV